ncbi:unnamed protein product [Protopolystoma xenopodis]|uniref:Uncharacterized protein n=1 Tax=Protopolystoma xenopodis TaxID=117903 RepID=A0A448XJ22_9PLAT|nr:unnamed protein product [Protopolystoma xenopodis]
MKLLLSSLSRPLIFARCYLNFSIGLESYEELDVRDRILPFCILQAAFCKIKWKIINQPSQLRAFGGGFGPVFRLEYSVCSSVAASISDAITVSSWPLAV